MAVAIPIIMSATGASAAIGASLGAALGVGAISATAISIGTGLVMAATGISAKIDKAASKVFGKDLVTVANIAGGLYLAAGGFSGGEASGGFAGDATAAGYDPGFGTSGGIIPTEVAGAAPVWSQAGADTMGALVRANVDAAGGAATMAQAPAATIAQPQTGVGGALSKVGAAWDKAAPTTKSALIQAGGNLLAGVAQGKAEEAAMDKRFEQEARYRSGSGLPYWQKAPNPYTPPGRA